MSIRRLTATAAVAVINCMVPADITPALAQSSSIYQSTLAEKGVKAPEISTEDMRRLMLDGSAILVDTRSRAEFDAGHIPGAMVLDAPPDEQVAAALRHTGGDNTKGLVLYCNGPYCQASRRLADKLVDAGFTNVRRYQLGIPVWRALGGPTAIETGGIKRIFGTDQTAVFIDARPAQEFAKGSLNGARNAPADKVLSGELKKIDLPEDDFNRRIVLFGTTGAEARKLADFMAKRPWHNVSYYTGTYAELARVLGAKN